MGHLMPVEVLRLLRLQMSMSLQKILRPGKSNTENFIVVI